MSPPFSTTLFDARWIAAMGTSVPVAKQKVMIVLHGRGDSMKSFSAIQNEMRLPEFSFLLLNAPWKFLDGYSWGALDPKPKGRMIQIRARLYALVGELKKAGYALEDIFWMGHSQGCLVAADLVLNHPARFGGLIGVSGYVWFFKGWKDRAARSGAQQTPWLITHGRYDRLIPLREIRRDVVRLAEGRVPVMYREFFKGHDFDFTDEVPFIRTWIRKAPVVAARRERLP